MHQQQQQQKDMTFRQHVGVALWLAWVVARPWWLVCSKPGTLGRRGVWSWAHAGCSAILLLLWGTATHSTVLLYWGGGALLLAELVHRVFPGRGHSYDTGESSLYREGGSNFRCRMAEAAVAVIAGGYTAWQLDYGTGSFMVASGLGHAAFTQFVRARQQHMDQDLVDAGHLAAAEEARMAGRFH